MKLSLTQISPNNTAYTPHHSTHTFTSTSPPQTTQFTAAHLVPTLPLTHPHSHHQRNTQQQFTPTLTTFQKPYFSQRNIIRIIQQTNTDTLSSTHPHNRQPQAHTHSYTRISTHLYIRTYIPTHTYSHIHKSIVLTTHTDNINIHKANAFVPWGSPDTFFIANKF